MAVSQAVKHLRIKVVDQTREGSPAVNINMPIGVVRWGMKMAKAFSPEMKNVDIDWDEVISMIQEGDLGKLVEVEDQANHKTVEVWVG